MHQFYCFVCGLEGSGNARSFPEFYYRMKSLGWTYTPNAVLHCPGCYNEYVDNLVQTGITLDIAKEYFYITLYEKGEYWFHSSEVASYWYNYVIPSSEQSKYELILGSKDVESVIIGK